MWPQVELVGLLREDREARAAAATASREARRRGAAAQREPLLRDALIAAPAASRPFRDFLMVSARPPSFLPIQPAQARRSKTICAKPDPRRGAPARVAR